MGVLRLDGCRIWLVGGLLGAVDLLEVVAATKPPGLLPALFSCTYY